MQINSSLELTRFAEQLQNATTNITFWGNEEVIRLKDGQTVNLHELPARLDQYWNSVLVIGKQERQVTKDLICKINNLFLEAEKSAKQCNCFTNGFVRIRRYWNSSNPNNPQSWKQKMDLWQVRLADPKDTISICGNQVKLQDCDMTALPANKHMRTLQEYFRVTRNIPRNLKLEFSLRDINGFLSAAHIKATVSYFGTYNVSLIGGPKYFVQRHWTMKLSDVNKILGEIWYHLQNSDVQQINFGLRLVSRIDSLYEEASKEMAKCNWLTGKLHQRQQDTWTKSDLKMWQQRFELLKSIEIDSKYEEDEKANIELRGPMDTLRDSLQHTKRTFVRITTGNTILPRQGSQETYLHPFRNAIVNKRVITAKVGEEPNIEIYDPATKLTKKITTIPDNKLIGPRKGNASSVLLKDIMLQSDTYNNKLFWQRGIEDRLNIWDSESGECIASILEDRSLEVNFRNSYFPNSMIYIRKIHHEELAVDARPTDEVWDLTRHEMLGRIPLMQDVPVEVEKYVEAYATRTGYFNIIGSIILKYTLPLFDGSKPLIIDMERKIIDFHIINEDRFAFNSISNDGEDSIEYKGEEKTKINKECLYLYDMDGRMIEHYPGYRRIESQYENKTGLMVAIEMNNPKNKFIFINTQDGSIKHVINVSEASFDVLPPYVVLLENKLIIFKFTHRQHLAYTTCSDYMWIYDIETGKEIGNHEIGQCMLPTKKQYDSTTGIVMLQHLFNNKSPNRKELFTFVDLKNGEIIGNFEMQLEYAIPACQSRKIVHYEFSDGIIIDPDRGFNDPPLLHDFGK